MNDTENKQALETDEMAGAMESLEDVENDTGGDVELGEFDKPTEPVVESPEKDKAGAPVPAGETANGDHAGWDKERQRADQAEANFRKMQQERDALAGKVDATNETIKQLESQLAKLAASEEVNLDSTDLSDTNPDVLKAIKSLQSQLKSQQVRADRLEQAKLDIENQIKTDHQEANREQVRQKIIVSLEGKLQKHMNMENPAKYRNEAIQKANQICEDRGYSPADRYEAAEMLEQCYLDLAAGTKSKGKPRSSIPTDTGKGSGAAPVVSEVNKPCSLRDAVKDLAKKVGIT